MGFVEVRALNVVVAGLTLTAFLGPLWMTLEIEPDNVYGYGLLYGWVRLRGELPLPATEAESFAVTSNILTVQLTAIFTLKVSLINLIFGFCGGLRVSRAGNYVVIILATVTCMLWPFIDEIEALREKLCDARQCDDTPISFTLGPSTVLVYLGLGYFAAVLAIGVAMTSVVCSDEECQRPWAGCFEAEGACGSLCVAETEDKVGTTPGPGMHPARSPPASGRARGWCF